MGASAKNQKNTASGGSSTGELNGAASIFGSVADGVPGAGGGRGKMELGRRGGGGRRGARDHRRFLAAASTANGERYRGFAVGRRWDLGGPLPVARRVSVG
ncbi:hypothetical protein BRADI_2g36012v3 [Brachypodium distachyon]|uniref:Uncharacterized protein n=1 Tax=Brachypodium distachyon TaxID=15368 RepID=A0A2K2DC05_BRADI|nr:hypothetical protein BRADI_2g36012v3 [Brachypodium distachyon]PNT71823.1 hypothetical protein BRADI_2g36012v3 [Brachypodium distachyon]PNT71824.1 hypothetical protein BRADI_2g36012v3 [Brachypodium distachyon]PNT71825.1 hypothetical protein BRADI_2g36012v3 [Brachypodium distachyon]PNT71826.1 hypothetical protein BRADI_2g36012v3 [Brachypodium distachyon]